MPTVTRYIEAKHAIVTDTCRVNKTDNGARDEALDRLRDEYDALLKNWPIGSGAKFHFVLAVEYDSKVHSG